MAPLEIYDCTLRDGIQQEGLSLTVGDKLQIARLIDQVGIGYFEGGWPGATPKDDEFFERAASELELKQAVLVAFGSTCRAGACAADDPQLRALADAGTKVVCIVGKAWDYQVTEILQTSLAEGERMTRDSVAFLKQGGLRVFFDAEHFFDGYRADPGYALRILSAAHEAGAERLVLCDTNGGTLPGQVGEVVASVAAALPGATLGVHFHNDSGCAVANTLAAVEAGVGHIQGCLNGYGERTGNADLCTLIPDLALKMGIPVVTPGQLASLTPIAHHTAEIANIAVDPHHPYVGTAAFAHKAGLHTSGITRRPGAYEHIDPAAVGNSALMIASELMGRSTVLAWAGRRGWDLDLAAAQEVVDRVKVLEHQGYLFEAADGSFELLIRKARGWSQDFFQAESFRSLVEQRPDGEVLSEATVKIRVGEQRFVVTREGDGPVHALDRALRAALVVSYPEVERIRLTDYRVRDLDSSDGTGARVRVLIECSNGRESWGTVGVHRNIVSASWEALESGVVLGLLRSREAAGPQT
jgi:2-isopropylmalate synthase